MIQAADHLPDHPVTSESDVNDHQAVSSVFKENEHPLTPSNLKSIVSDVVNGAFNTLQDKIGQMVQQAIQAGLESYPTINIANRQEDGNEDVDDGNEEYNDSEYDDDLKKENNKPRYLHMQDYPHPSGYEAEDLSKIKLALNPTMNRRYTTSVYYDALYIANGHPPGTKMIKGKEYAKRYGVENVKFSTSTFYSTLWNQGFRIINYPYGLPVPTSVDSPDCPGPQTFSHAMITTFLRQYCHPDPTRRFQFICRNEDLVHRMPFISRPADKNGIAAPDSVDFPTMKPGDPAFRREDCHCPLHRGNTDYWRRFLPSSPLSHSKTTKKNSTKGKEKATTKSAATPSLSPLQGPITRSLARNMTSPPKTPTNTSLTSAISPHSKRSIYNIPCQSEDELSNSRKRVKHVDTSLSSTATAILATLSPSPVPLQWRSNLDVIKWATHIMPRYKSKLESDGFTKERRDDVYQRMIGRVEDLFSNIDPRPWLSFDDIITDAEAITNQDDPSLCSTDGMMLWISSSILIVEKHLALTPNSTQHVQKFIDIFKSRNIDQDILTSAYMSLNQILNDRMFEL